MRRTTAAVALAAALAGLTGCTMAPQPAHDPTMTDDDDVTATVVDQPEGIMGKGHVSYPDGVNVAMSKPESYTPSRTAYTEQDRPYYVQIKVTVTNGSDERIDPILANVTAASGDTEAVPVIDVEGNLSSTPTTDIRPGHKRSWDVAFGVDDPDDLTAEFALNDLVHDSALFMMDPKGE